jgi:hypothetical protein
MYKFLLPLPLILLISLCGMAQTRTAIKGKITDSLTKQPVEFATVAVLNAKDTTAASLITYAQTDKDGMFSLQNLPVATSLKVVVSFVGYKPYIKFFTMVKGQTMDMSGVTLSPRQLNEVVIKGERMPITVSKDTIEFDATAFKTRPNAVVEDLLKKLPGVEVDNQGKITVLGKDVKKILVDGREFFASDPRIATKNLDADMIAKVQVYDDREDDPNHIIPDNEVNKIINLKFKKALKKSTFGKMYGGMGTQDHYQAGGLINTFRDTLQVSALGYTNNLNSTGFDYNDLYNNGGTKRGGDAFSGLGFSGGGNGKQTRTSTGININTDYGKKLKINLNYLYNHTQTEFNTLYTRQQFLTDTTVTTASASDRLNRNDNHMVTGSVYYKPSEATQYRYDPALTINDNGSNGTYTGSSYNNFINPVNRTNNNSNSSNNSLQFRHTFSFNHYLKKKGSTLNITHNLNINPRGDGNSYDIQNLVSYLSTIPSYTFNRFSDNTNRNNSGTVNANYRNMLSKKLTFDVSLGTDFNNDQNKAATYDYNPITGNYDSFVITLSSDLDRRKWAETLNPGVTYNPTKTVSITAHISNQFLQVNNAFQRGYADLKQNYFILAPVINIRLNQVFLSYNRYTQLPNIGDMIPYSIVYNPLSSVTGNPGLKPTVSDRFNIGLNKYNFQTGNNISLNASVSFDHNSIFRQRTINSQLVETSMPINRNGRYYYYLSANMGKQIKKQKDFQMSMNTGLNFNQGHDFFVINHQDGYQNSYRTSLTERLSLNYKDIIQLEPQYALSHVYTTYAGVDYNNQSNLTHSVDTHFLFYFLQKYNLEGNYAYRYNPQVAPGYQKSSNLLSVNLAHQFLKKDRGEIKLSCYDLLNQNISNFRNIYENTISDSQTQIIKRYFMLTLQIKFNKSTVKEDPKPKTSLSTPMIIFPTGRM